MAGIYKEYYDSVIKENFYPNGDWLEKLDNYDVFVENNALNLASIGADPDVIINNTTWPLVPVTASASGHRVELATFDTKPTHLTNVEEMETNFEYAVAVTKQHRSTLHAKAAVSAAYNIAPLSNSANMPVVETVGTSFSFDDIINTAAKFDELLLPADGRIFLINPTDLAALRKQDYKLYKDLLQNKECNGFDIHITTVMPTYTAGTKDPMGTAIPGKKSSIAFCKGENIRAMGDIEGEPEFRWSDYRGWLIGFQMRFLAMNLRGKGVCVVTNK